MNAKPNQPAHKEHSGVLTQSQQIRLECLRLVFHPAKDADYLIAKAAELERYVTDSQPKGRAKAPETDRQDDPNAPI